MRYEFWQYETDNKPYYETDIAEKALQFWMENPDFYLLFRSAEISCWFYNLKYFLRVTLFKEA